MTLENAGVRDAPVLIYSTFPSAEAAEETGAALVDAGLAACVNILPGMTSLYVWQGEHQRSSEAAMIIKTRRGLAGAVMAEVRRRHAYETPALLVLPVEGGSAPFLDWIVAMTGGTAGAAGGESGQNGGAE